MIRKTFLSVYFMCLNLSSRGIFALQQSTTTTNHLQQTTISRRSVLALGPSVAAAASLLLTTSNVYALEFETSKTGLQYADAKIGSGQALKPGSTATVDYVLSTTGARYGTKIFSTQDKDTPYRWTLGDGSTISGIELAILGSDDIPAMLPGGIRRVVIPQRLGYDALAKNPKTLCVQDGKPGPIPPPNTAFEEYQRFKNIYCNSERQYQPEIVIDLKLYGARR